MAVQQTKINLKRTQHQSKTLAIVMLYIKQENLKNKADITKHELLVAYTLRQSETKMTK